MVDTETEDTMAIRNPQEATPPTLRHIPGIVTTNRRITIAWTLAFIAAIAFTFGGAYTISRGLEGRNEVIAQLTAEKVVTPDDASIPGVPVVDHVTAHSMANVIAKHSLEATGGKTYAELDREDPLRAVAFQADALRTALLSAALAFHTSQFAMGVGAFMVAVGGLMLIVLLLMHPSWARRKE